MSASRRCAVRFAMFAGALLLVSQLALAQTVGTGTIVGLVSDPAGAAIAGAKVNIKNTVTGAVIHVTTSSDGFYTSGPIQPGHYLVRVEAKGFSTTSNPWVVQVGNVANGDVKMQVGEAPQVQVPGGTAVNVEQPTVQSVLQGEQVAALPIGGRNFLDLAQFEPGVQVQDASTLDPSKVGLSSSSFQGRFGRTTRVELDGTDVSDETVGTTTENIASSAIREFQVSQSLLDLTTGLTAGGAVNVITRSGSDQVHGELFGLFRSHDAAAELPGSTDDYFQREQFGGNAGGAIIKNKVFWFADAERARQNLTTAEPFAFPFNGLNTTLVEPYRDFYTDERVDWNMRGSTRAFYRFNFFQNSDLRPFGSASSTQQLNSSDHTQVHTLGVDFNTGVYAHSIRAEYLKYRNATGDATSGLSAVDNPIPGLGINIGASTAGNCVLSNGGSYCGGPSWLAPQQTVQSNEEVKYDGSRVLGKHILRYGGTFNRIQGGRTAALSAFPQAGTTAAGPSLNPSDPTSYAAEWVSLGNGNGFSTNRSAFGFPGGGLGPDNRVEMYFGDGWKIKPRVTLTYGVRYLHDTNRNDSNLGGLPDLNQWAPGLGNEIRNPKNNLAPQLGVAWDAGGNGKTVIRAGGGLFFENTLWNNVLYDSPARLTNGVFADAPTVCQGGVASAFVWPTSLAGVSSIAGGAATVVNTPAGPEAQPTFCGGTISTVAPEIMALSSAFQAATAGAARVSQTATSLVPHSRR